jgi:hypothetical protein
MRLSGNLGLSGVTRHSPGPMDMASRNVRLIAKYYAEVSPGVAIESGLSPDSIGGSWTYRGGAIAQKKGPGGG